jgi:phage/plasmid-associated DNA primase
LEPFGTVWNRGWNLGTEEASITPFITVRRKGQRPNKIYTREDNAMEDNRNTMPVDDLKQIYHLSEDRKKQIMDVIDNSDMGKGRNDSMSLRGAIKLIVKGICTCFPDPHLMGNSEEAWTRYEGVVLNAISMFVVEINRSKNGAPIKFKHEINEDVVRELIHGNWTIYNFCTSMKDKQGGIGFGISKDVERDPEGMFVPLDQIVNEYKTELLPSSVSANNLKERVLLDSRTVIHITDKKIENRNKYLAKASPLGNGIYHPDLYPTEGMLTNRKAVEEYDLFIPFRFAGCYRGPDYKPPVMPDGWDPQTWEAETYGTTEERAQQLPAMRLAVLRPYDTSYTRAFFFLDKGGGNTGKSTVAESVRSMCGQDTVADLSMADLSSEYGPSILADYSKHVVVRDENEPKDYIQNATIFKSCVTADPFIARAIYEGPKSVVYRGRIIQIINGMIRSKDNGPAFYRRCYPMIYRHKIDNGDGIGAPRNNNIKEQWINNPDVRDWFVTYAINKNIETLPMTAESQDILADMESDNNIVLKFFEEYVDNMYQTWWTPRLLFPAFLAYCEDKGHNTGWTEGSFKNEIQMLMARANAKWMYTPESEDRPEKIRAIKTRPHTVPLRGVMGPSNGDPIYNLLHTVTRPGCKTKIKVENAKASLDKLYNTNDAGKQNNVFYRKPTQTADLYMDLARSLVGSYYVEDEEEMDISEVLRLLSDWQAYRPRTMSESGTDSGNKILKELDDGTLLVQIEASAERKRESDIRNFLIDKLTSMKGA